MKPGAVIFDRDLTLTCVAAPDVARLEGRLALLAPGLSLPGMQTLWEGWPGPWPRAEEDELAFWGQFCAAYGATCGLAPAVVEGLAAELATSYPIMFRAYPDAAPSLAALSAAGLRLAVLTNFELPSVGRTLANAGLDPAMFQATLSAAALGWPKPDPRAFAAAAAALGLPLAACCLVDDLAENVAAARSIGMRAYQIDRSLPGPTADGRIGSLLDLIGLLASPGAGPEPRPHVPSPYDISA
jgi:FMN phosphatase YigB (HAD superfamily)